MVKADSAALRLSLCGLMQIPSEVLILQSRLPRNAQVRAVRRAGISPSMLVFFLIPLTSPELTTVERQRLDYVQAVGCSSWNILIRESYS